MRRRLSILSAIAPSAAFAAAAAPAHAATQGNSAGKVDPVTGRSHILIRFSVASSDPLASNTKLRRAIDAGIEEFVPVPDGIIRTQGSERVRAAVGKPR